MDGEISARFWAKVNKTDSCWLWTASKVNGYGKFRYQGRQMMAHRLAYEALVGPIPEGLTIDHLCHTRDSACSGGVTCQHRSCVNPAHHEPVPKGVNTLRGGGPTARHARRTHCAKGHPLVQGKTQRWCPLCRQDYIREREARRRLELGIPAGKGGRNAVKTHCAQGHPFDAENTAIGHEGRRRCRICIRAWQREYKARVKARASHETAPV